MNYTKIDERIIFQQDGEGGKKNKNKNKNILPFSTGYKCDVI